jgi:predicted helicase
MVVMGNPPYSVSSQNKGDWISTLIEDYKKNLNEKKLNLDDDFIKFFRFAQWRINQTGYGILAFISNNVYLDGLTHRRMRESLMNTFDDIYILDLHGNSNKKERSPDGSKDENVFDIQQGVAIGIFVKKPESRGATRVKHAELWGLRKTKYQVLLDTDVSNTAWKELTDVDRESCLGSFRFFTPKAFDNIDEYCEGWSVKNIFRTFQNAIKTDRDDLFYDFDKTTLQKRMKTFYSEEGLSPTFRDQYRVQDSSSYALLSRRLSTSFDSTNIRQTLYRPFDIRYLYYAPGLTSRPAWEVMQHMIDGTNIGLITTRQTSDDWDCLVTNIMCGHKSVAAYDINSLLPLYLYTNNKGGLFELASVVNRETNLDPNFVGEFGTRLGLIFLPDGKGDRLTSFGPEDVFDYLYAVFHSPNYRRRYKEFVRIDFARLPLTSNGELFRGLCALGSKLVSLHLLNEHIPLITTYPIAGKSKVEAVRYVPSDAQANFGGRVWINNSQYFDGVPADVWNFKTGGYQVCNRWLKDRKDRELTYEELTNYQRIVSALNETFTTMSEIDNLIDKHGGWPIR